MSPRQLSCLALLLAVACTTYDREFYVGHDRLEIARVDHPDGSSESYELEVGNGRADASLTVRTEYQRERAFLGLKVAELDRATAEPRGVEPYRGLLVTGTYPRSAAAEAGLVAGDIVLAVGADKVVYRDQLPKVEASLRPDQPIGLRVLRGREEKEISLQPKALRDRIVEPESIALEATEGRRPYAGVVLRGIPRTWCERIWGDERNAVVIASVDVGSPAWVAGFRAGDLIEKVDGAPVGDVHATGELIHSRGQGGGSLQLQVRRGREEQFTADVQLADYSTGKQIWFPLVFRVRDGAREDTWTVGPLGLLASNTNTYVDEPRGREPETRNVFDAVLGLIHVDNRPDRKRLRLLWFISIDL